MVVQLFVGRISDLAESFEPDDGVTSIGQGVAATVQP